MHLLSCFLNTGVGSGMSTCSHYCALADFGENVCKHVLANNNFQAFVEEKAGFLNSC